MSECQAARVDDEIAHTASKGWMIAGLVGGAILGAAAVVVTGGTALVAVSAVAAGACAAGGLGELLGSMSWATRHTTGTLKKVHPMSLSTAEGQSALTCQPESVMSTAVACNGLRKVR